MRLLFKMYYGCISLNFYPGAIFEKFSINGGNITLGKPWQVLAQYAIEIVG